MSSHSLSRKLRLMLNGTSKSGKTHAGLAVASGIADYLAETTGNRGRIAVIDTEHDSNQYANLFDFDVLFLHRFDPRNYVAAIQEAENKHYDVIMIDSLSHAWTGVAAAREKGNSFVALREVTSAYNELVDVMLGSTAHLIVTMQTPIQREGTEYEFDVVIDMNPEQTGVIRKSRFAEIDGQVIDRPGAALGRKLAAWLAPRSNPES